MKIAGWDYNPGLIEAGIRRCFDQPWIEHQIDKQAGSPGILFSCAAYVCIIQVMVDHPLGNSKLFREIATELGKDKFAWFCIAVGAIFLFINIKIIWEIDIWRHDYIGYTSTYLNKLVAEGRWINYILYSVIKVIPPHLSIVIRLVSFFLIIFLSAQAVSKDYKYSLILALAALQANSLYPELLWPNLITLGYVILAVAYACHAKVRPWVYFLVSGVILFGISSVLYFVIPLFFINRIYQSGNRTKELVNILIAWIVFYIVGYIAAQAVTYILAERFFTLASWRHPNPPNSLDAIVINIKTTIRYFEYTAFRFSGVGFKMGYLFNTALLGYFLYQKKFWQGGLLCVFVSLSVYANALPFGIAISPRTCLPLWLGGLFLVFLWPEMSHKEKQFAYIGLLIFMLNFFPLNKNSLEWYKTMTNVLKTELALVIPSPPEFTQEVRLKMKDRVLFERVNKIAQNLGLEGDIEEGVGSSKRRLVPALRSLGYKCKVSFEEGETGSAGSGKRLFNANVTEPGKILIGLN